MHQDARQEKWERRLAAMIGQSSDGGMLREPYRKSGILVFDATSNRRKRPGNEKDFHKCQSSKAVYFEILSARSIYCEFRRTVSRYKLLEGYVRASLSSLRTVVFGSSHP